jgi:hypothetical protein
MNALFCSATAPLLQQPAARQPRQPRSFDMASVRRSARLASKPLIPAIQKAQRNLHRKLGLGNNDNMTIDEVL